MEAELAELKEQVKQLTARVNKVQGQNPNSKYATTAIVMLTLHR
jgi:hypothetical protein